MDSIKVTTPVYNKYLHGDFQVGQDNLNPVRELELDTLKDIDKLQAQMYAQYKDKIEKLTGDGIVVAPEGLGLPYGDRTQVTTPLSLTDTFPLKTDETTTVESDVQKVMKMLNAVLGGEPISYGDLPFDICADRVAAGASTGGATTSPTDDGENTTSTTGNTDNVLANVSSDPLFAGNASTNNKNSELKCIMIELDFLQIILAIVNFLRVILMLEQMALSIIYPILEIVTLIVSSILNPAAVGQLSMMLVGIAMAIGISFLTDMISKLLGNLNLDCLLSSSMSLVQDVMGTVSATRDTGSAARSFISFNKNIATGIGTAVSSRAAFAAALGVTEEQLDGSSNISKLFTAAAEGAVEGVTTSPVGTAATGTAGAVAGSISSGVAGAASLVKDFFPNGKFVVY